MSTPSIIVGRGNWGVKTGNLLGYSLIDSLYLPREFTCSRADNTATRVNRNGNIEGVNANVPRIDYFGGQASLLVEPSGTNGIRNNSMAGAVTGTPGALPTGGGWATVLRGLTQTVVGTGTENGINYIDIRFSGNATSTDLVEIRYESNTQIVASSGQTWAHSVYLKKIVEPNPPNNYQLAIYERDSVGNFVAFGASTIAPTTTIQRFTQTRTLSGAATTRVQPALFFGITNLQSYDFTIRIGYPQMELSSVATSVIPTTSGPVTRNNDSISLTGVAGLIGQTEGTIYAEVAYSAIPVTKTIIAITDGTANNRIAIRINSTTVITARIVVAGASNDYNVTIPAIPSSGILKISLAYKADDYVFAINGTTYASTTTRPVPATNAVTLGNNGFNGDFLNDRILAAEIYPTRLPNVAQPGVLSLQSLTAI